MNSKLEVEFYQVLSKGDNALDFHLTALAAAYVPKNPQSSFYVISNDKDFRHLIKYCSYMYGENVVDISIHNSIQGVYMKQQINIETDEVKVADYLFLAK